jgi:hypothetical protein
MTTVKISTAASAGRALVAAARAADANRDGVLTTAEIHRATTRNGRAATQALLSEHAAHRRGIARDPEIPQRDKSVAMKKMDVEEVKFMVDAGVEQLKRIDGYKGTKRPARPANSPDGFVTSAEVANYGPTGGKFQVEASRLVAFTLDSTS